MWFECVMKVGMISRCGKSWSQYPFFGPEVWCHYLRAKYKSELKQDETREEQQSNPTLENEGHAM